MSFLRYPEYKDSGVEWLGEVPAHWGAMPLRRFHCVLQTGPFGSQLHAEEYVVGGTPVINPVNLVDGRIVPSENVTVAADVVNRLSHQRLQVGDIVFARRGELGRCARVTDAENGWLCGTGSMILRLDDSDFDSGFLSQYLALDLIREYFVSRSIGAVMDSLSSETLLSAQLLLPPLPEQQLIRSFLDRETAKIDALVAEQRLLMELLKEKRQAVISHAVTKGLNPDAPMQDSGVEWLGEVPAHWAIARLANVFCEVVDAGTNDLPILSVSIHHGVSDREMDDEELDRKVTRSDDRSKYKQVQPGDLVYNMMRAWQGGFGTVAVEGMVSPAYVVARPLRAITTEYIEHLLRTPQAIEQMRRHSRGVTDFRLRLYWNEFKNIRVAIPPESEGVGICAAIAKMDEEFDALSAACEAAIAVLNERRTALISAAVTGQIDVRNLAPASA